MATSENEPHSTVASVLITGGGSGIGAALATELAHRRCRVLISGRRAQPLDEAAQLSKWISVCAGDVTDHAHRAALATTLADLPGPRAIVHAAGYLQTGLLDILSLEQRRRSFATNVEARWLLSCACAESLDEGRVLFIGSDAGVHLGRERPPTRSHRLPPRPSDERCKQSGPTAAPPLAPSSPGWSTPTWSVVS